MITLLIVGGALAVAVIGNAIIGPSTRPTQKGPPHHWQV